ncbi:MAG: SAM-dependent methyltransferase [Candidatus Dormibacteraeota bacterium]|nr:SAM-dependent methyltransferase [Candidatus Dormibacteraeota bacterium]
MSDCCTPRGYRQMFSERSARGAAARYRKRGLDGVSRRVVNLLIAEGVEGKSVLEVGGGVGAIQLELLRAGAATAVSIELTPTYEAAAAELLAETGLGDRVERRVIDFVEAGGEVAAADIVILNRVVCCYPDMPRLVGTAAAHARSSLVMSFPKQRWWTRAVLAMGNLGFRLTRREFHVFLHSPARIRQAAEAHGLTVRSDRPGVFWEVLAAAGSAAGSAAG